MIKDKNLRIYTQVFGGEYQHLLDIKFDELDDVIIDTFNIERIFFEQV